MPKKAKSNKGHKAEMRGAIGDMKSGGGKPGSMAHRAEARLESRKPKKKK